MFEIRSFLNTDSPAIVNIWQQQKPFRCFSQVMSRQLFDRMVLAKPYFDASGFFLAMDGDEVLGFAHAGFGASADKSDVDCSVGVVSQLRVIPGDDRDEVAVRLLESSLNYLTERGAKECYAAGRFPDSPFYVGIYGGSRIPGVPAEDVEMAQWMSNCGFEPGEQIAVLQRNLQGFRPAVSRALMTTRRQFQVSAMDHPMLPNWWECCTFGWSEVYGFQISRRSDQEVVGSVLFWEIQPLSSQWGKRTMGLVDLAISPESRQQGLGTFLIIESLRQLADNGVACIELQARSSDEPTQALARKLGFEQISTGQEMRRELAPKS